LALTRLLVLPVLNRRQYETSQRSFCSQGVNPTSVWETWMVSTRSETSETGNMAMIVIIYPIILALDQSIMDVRLPEGFRTITTVTSVFSPSCENWVNLKKLVKLALHPLLLFVPVVCVCCMLSTSLLRRQIPFSCYFIPFLRCTLHFSCTLRGLFKSAILVRQAVHELRMTYQLINFSSVEPCARHCWILSLWIFDPLRSRVGKAARSLLHTFRCQP